MQKINDIKMVPVNSSQIDSIGYSEQERILAVRFDSNRLYYYMDVDQNEYLQFLNATSVGKYFHGFIRNVYEYERINEEV
jgi:hypothetical protein